MNYFTTIRGKIINIFQNYFEVKNYLDNNKTIIIYTDEFFELNVGKEVDVNVFVEGNKFYLRQIDYIDETLTPDQIIKLWRD